MRSVKFLCLPLLALIALAGCDSLIPANQKVMKEAIAAGDQAVRSEEKVWAMLLRIEELTQRLEAAVRRADEAAAQAEDAVKSARELVEKNTLQQTKQGEKQTEKQADLAAAAAKQAERAEAAAKQAEEIARRIEAKEGENLQKMLEFMRELGAKP